MEQGKLVSAEVLPKVAKEFQKAALEGGAFEQALKGLRVTEGQMMTSTQRAADTIFKSGFSEGLSELYKTISQILKDSTPALQKFGATMGRVFKGIAHILKVIEPFFNAFISNLEILTGAYALYSIKKLTTAFGGLGIAIRSAFLPVTAALFALEEIASLMSDKLVGNLETQMGQQVNLLNMTKSKLYEKDGKLMSGGAEEMKFFDFASVGTKFARQLNPATNLYDNLSSLFADKAISKGQPASSITMYIQVDAPSEDVAAGFVDRMKIEALGR
ncbi:hypothetical protein [Pseudoalteromonas phage PH357]|nr:hypothetical protein [Pseudoalteromonas phage PH357]